MAQTIRRTKTQDAQTLKVLKQQISHKYKRLTPSPADVSTPVCISTRKEYSAFIGRLGIVVICYLKDDKRFFKTVTIVLEAPIKIFG
jgi:hypothetical protein